MPSSLSAYAVIYLNIAELMFSNGTTMREGDIAMGPLPRAHLHRWHTLIDTNADVSYDVCVSLRKWIDKCGVCSLV